MAAAQSLGHFVVPVDDIVAAEEFYVRLFGGIPGKRYGGNVLGFVLQSRRANLKQTTLRMASGQTLILTETPLSPKGLVMSARCRDAHRIFCSRRKLDRRIKHLEKLSIEHGDRRKGRRPGRCSYCRSNWLP
jgi:hypothetical protein